MLVGFDDDLAGEATRITNRIRGLLTQVHPALERVLGPKLGHKAVLEILSRHGGPAGLRAAGRRRLIALARKHVPHMGERLIDEGVHRPGSPDPHRPGARPRPRPSCPAWPTRCARSWTSASSWPPKWKGSSMRTLLRRLAGPLGPGRAALCSGRALGTGSSGQLEGVLKGFT